jgi:hypothetical protein
MLNKVVDVWFIYVNLLTIRREAVMPEKDRTCEIRYVIGDALERPQVVPHNDAPRYYVEGGQTIPEDWEIYNAPRPLGGHLTWLDTDGPGGWFWAAVDPEGEFADEYRDRLYQNDARQLVWISEDQFYDVVQRYADSTYGEGRFDAREFNIRELYSTFGMAVEEGFDPQDN